VIVTHVLDCDATAAKLMKLTDLAAGGAPGRVFFMPVTVRFLDWSHYFIPHDLRYYTERTRRHRPDKLQAWFARTAKKAVLMFDTCGWHADRAAKTRGIPERRRLAG
jgi:hypothetical protein